MSTITHSDLAPSGRSWRTMASKVPEVTVYFWVIKILCTTVGESLADWLNTTVGLGLGGTTALFVVVLAGALTVQFRRRAYVPAVYWASVVLLSVVGTLLTDELTDSLHVPLWASTLAFSTLLVLVFGTW